MSKQKEFKSIIAPHLQGFLDEKRSLGFKYETQASILHEFDSYWIAHCSGDTKITIENIDCWIQKRETEGDSFLQDRVSVIREFSRYLNGIGIPSYIPPLEVQISQAVVHLLTKPEITDFFTQVDNYMPTRNDKDLQRVAKEYRLLFRFLYLEGTRITETCSLHTKNIDLGRGIVTILNGKGKKDRIVYLADDMRRLCIKYYNYLCTILGEEPEWFFPGRYHERHISIGGTEKQFNEFWSKTKYSDTCSKKPTVHCLRHTFIVNRINLWLSQGISFERMLPYLSKFLGHSDFRDTYYYYHYAEDAAKTIHELDKAQNDVIPEAETL